MKLLYITYIDFGEMGSGSSVRPQRMAEAFHALGVEIYIVKGLQNNRQQRRQTIACAMEWLKSNRPDACYIEPPSCPIYLKEDHRLIRAVHALEIPTGIFYRDAHWLYADWWGVTGLKAMVLRQMHRRDLRLFTECCDRVYFPSASMGALFRSRPFRATGILPPACQMVKPAHEALHHRMIYVGGVRPAYGTDLLLAAFRQLWQEGMNIELVLCCREEELQNLPGETFQAPLLTVIHETADKLQNWYDVCDAGLLPLRRERYMDFAIPVKLFEYWGNALPVIATDCPETAAMVRQYHAGIVCEASAKGLANAIRDFYKDSLASAVIGQNVQNAARQNRWQDRAWQVLQDLCP